MERSSPSNRKLLFAEPGESTMGSMVEPCGWAPNILDCRAVFTHLGSIPLFTSKLRDRFAALLGKPVE